MPDYHRPQTVEAAAELLAQDTEVHCLAGGATLVALMNARLVEPAGLVSLADIPELQAFERLADGTARIGAMRRHRETAFESDLRDGQRVVQSAARQIANPPVRNMGTIGGSIAFADPAADYPPALVAADAVVEIASARGRRELPAQEFFVDWYTTALEPGELVLGVRLPPGSPGAVGHYEKLARVAGDFATASIALVLRVESGACAEIRLAVGGCGPTPVRVAEAEAALTGSTLDAAALERAGRMLAKACDPVDDVRASAEYRQLVVPRLLQRAVSQALQQAEAPA